MSPRCPLCERPATPGDAPFCSRGCRDRDLLRWFGEGYRIPGRGTVDGDPAAGVDKPHGPD